MIQTELAISESEILPGDVLLYRPRRLDFVAKKIVAATSSPYTHAAVSLGHNLVADSTPPCGVRQRKLQDSLRSNAYAAVLRSQAGFLGDRPERLSHFVKSVCGPSKFYNLIAAINLPAYRQKVLSNQLEFIRNNYGKAKSAAEFSKQSFFCSAFVVACYSVVGIIGETAQAAYLPNSFAPGHLSEDPTFGWLLGYLVSNSDVVPDDDPLLISGTHWRDHVDSRWW